MTASQSAIPDVRLRHLVGRVHDLGPRPLYELFRELIAGADPLPRIERYAELDAGFIQALGGDQFAGPRIVSGGRN